MVETWRGIYPVTAFVRDALRSKLGQVERDALLEPEQTLLTACEFWSSVNTGGLGDRMRQRKMIPLMHAQQAFTDIGAVRVASVLHVLVAELARDPEPANLEQQKTEGASASFAPVRKAGIRNPQRFASTCQIMQAETSRHRPGISSQREAWCARWESEASG